MKGTTMKWLTLALLLLVGCGPSGRLTTPPGFAELGEDGPFAYRAATARGVVIGARVADNHPRGNLDFWSDTVDRKLARDGYVLEDRRQVRSRSGLAGTMMRYTLDGTRYLVTVYTTAEKVYVVDAAGDAAEFDPLAETIARAELSLH
jgi:hypothetical protein